MRPLDATRPSDRNHPRRATLRSLLVPFGLALALVAPAQPVSAIPGPDPASADTEFSIVITGSFDGETEVFDELRFSRTDNWDFGDREAYRCAFVEYIVDGIVQFKLEFERLQVPDHDENYIVINDRHGMETGEGGVPPAPSDDCGLPAGAGARTWDGAPLVEGGANFTVFKDGAPYMNYSLPSTAPDNDETFWSVGNDPGEAYMWYIEEGEADDAVLRFSIVPVAPGVSLEPAVSPPSGNHPANLTLDLRGHLKAVGDVRVPDGTSACERGRLVILERRVSGDWTRAGSDLSSRNGHYVINARNQAGVYRTRVSSESLAGGGVCDNARSQTRRYRG